MQADSFNVNQPPSAEARVRQFLDLSDEYLLLVPLRRESPAYFTEGSTEALMSLREGLLAHMLMRKFITKGESENLEMTSTSRRGLMTAGAVGTLASALTLRNVSESKCD